MEPELHEHSSGDGIGKRQRIRTGVNHKTVTSTRGAGGRAEDVTTTAAAVVPITAAGGGTVVPITAGQRVKTTRVATPVVPTTGASPARGAGQSAKTTPVATAVVPRTGDTPAQGAGPRGKTNPLPVAEVAEVTVPSRSSQRHKKK